MNKLESINGRNIKKEEADLIEAYFINVSVNFSLFILKDLILNLVIWSFKHKNIH